MTINGETINTAVINGAVALDEEDYQLWLRNPASAVAHLVEIDYNGDSAVYENWVKYTLKSSDSSALSFTGYPDRVKSIGSFSRQIGDKFTGVVGASIGEIEFYNEDGSLDSWPRLAIDGQRVRVLHGDPSWSYERFRVVYECIAEAVSSASWDSLKLRLRGIDYKSNLPLQTNLIGTTTTNSSSNLPIPKAYGSVFNITPGLIDNVNLIYQWNDGSVTSVSDCRDGGVRFQTAQIAISSVTGDVMSTATAHGFYAGTRVRCDVGSFPSSANWVPIAWNGKVFCCLTNNAGIGAVSSDGIRWYQVTIPTYHWFGMVWNGTIFCAVSISSSNTAMTSPDGITWTLQTLPASGDWVDISWNGSVFCAVGYTTIAATSPDGITWTLQTLPASANWSGIAWNGSVFCAIAQSSSIAATSPDGITWTLQTLPVSSSWTKIAWNGSVFCTIAYATSIAATSPDGVTWTQRTLPASAGWRPIAWNGSVFCIFAVVGLTCATSPDGINWTLGSPPTEAVSLAWNGNVFCAVSDGSKVTVSTDGITWAPISGTLPTPLTAATDYWVIPDGLTTTAFKLSATRGGTPITLTNTTTGAAIIGYHWTADLTTGKLYLDSKPLGALTMDGVAGSTDASTIVVSALSAVNIDPNSQRVFQSICNQTMGIYVDQRRNRLDVVDDVIQGIGAWYGYGREGLMKFGRVEGNPTAYSVALIEDDFLFNVLSIEKLIPPEKQHRLSYRKNYTNQAGALFANVSADNRFAFSNDYSATQPSTGTDVGANGSFHALAIIPDVHETQIQLAAEAKTEANRLDTMYFGWGAIFSGTVGRIGTLIDIGDVVKITHSRYGLDAGVNMTCVYIQDNPSADTTDLKFFVALDNYTPGQL